MQDSSILTLGEEAQLSLGKTSFSSQTTKTLSEYLGRQHMSLSSFTNRQFRPWFLHSSGIPDRDRVTSLIPRPLLDTETEGQRLAQCQETPKDCAPHPLPFFYISCWESKQPLGVIPISHGGGLPLAISSFPPDFFNVDPPTITSINGPREPA